MGKLVKIKSGRQWSTQKEALAHFKNMLHRYANGDVIEDASDVEDLTGLLATYDNARSSGESPKAGSGINHFKRLNNAGPGWSTDGFWVFRNDGTSIDFSYIEAVKFATVK